MMTTHIHKGHIEYESRSAWTTIALIAGLIVPLLVALCCAVSQVYRRSGRLSLRYQSAQAAKRRNSVLALSTLDLSSAAGAAKRNGDSAAGTSTATPPPSASSSASSPSSSARASSVPSSANPRRSYDAVYRTGEPLPGKPDVPFDAKPWDLDAEYEGQLDKVDKRTAIYVPGSPPSAHANGPRTSMQQPPPLAGPSVAVQRQILPSKFKDFSF